MSVAPDDSSASHAPVLPLESIAALAIRPDGCYVDATFGRGGHSLAILAALGPHGRLFAIDRDPEAERTALRWSDPRFRFIRSPFGRLATVLADAGVARIDGLLVDLGVSSPQFDDPARGFSFRGDGPLDMRMDPASGESAAQWIARVPFDELAEVIAGYGEERHARRIARAIVASREREAIRTTSSLAQLVRSVVGRGRRPAGDALDPATRTFQAVRIHINDELGELARLLEASLGCLAPGARLVVISFHSLEDRIVKRFIRAQSGRGPVDPRLARLPVDIAPRPRRLAEIGGLLRPGADECARNPRAGSARMRVAERTVNP